MVHTGGSGVRVALILMVSPCFCAFIDEGATAGVDVRNHSHFFNKSITTVSPLPKCVNHDLHIWGMIEPTTISTTPRVAIISPSGPARFWGEPPSIALRRHGRSPMRSLPSGALLLVWDVTVLTGPTLGHRVRPLSKDAELTARRWLDQVADNPGFLDTLIEAARITDGWHHATPPHIQAPYRTLHQ